MSEIKTPEPDKWQQVVAKMTSANTFDTAEPMPESFDDLPALQPLGSKSTSENEIKTTLKKSLMSNIRNAPERTEAERSKMTAQEKFKQAKTKVARRKTVSAMMSDQMSGGVHGVTMTDSTSSSSDDSEKQNLMQSRAILSGLSRAQRRKSVALWVKSNPKYACVEHDLTNAKVSIDELMVKINHAKLREKVVAIRRKLESIASENIRLKAMERIKEKAESQLWDPLFNKIPCADWVDFNLSANEVLDKIK